MIINNSKLDNMYVDEEENEIGMSTDKNEKEKGNLFSAL